MNCPACGRSLVTGARKCAYCGHGTQVRPVPQLAVAHDGGGSTPRRRFMSAWVRFLLFSGIVVGGAYMAYRHVPEIKEYVDKLLASVIGR